MKKNIIVGVLVISIFFATYGYVDISNKILNHFNSGFRIGSIGTIIIAGSLFFCLYKLEEYMKE